MTFDSPDTPSQERHQRKWNIHEEKVSSLSRQLHQQMVGENPLMRQMSSTEMQLRVSTCARSEGCNFVSIIWVARLARIPPRALEGQVIFTARYSIIRHQCEVTPMTAAVPLQIMSCNLQKNEILNICLARKYVSTEFVILQSFVSKILKCSSYFLLSRFRNI